MSKPRSDAKLLNLPEEQQAELAEWLLGGMAYHTARALVEKQFGVRCSLSAFSQFFVAVCQPLLLKRRSRMIGVADELAEEVAKEPGRFDAATVDSIKQKALELAISPLAQPKDIKALFMLLTKARDQDLKVTQLAQAKEFKERDQALKAEQLALDQRRIKLLEEAARQKAEAEGVMKDTELSPEEQARRVKQIFGIS